MYSHSSVMTYNNTGQGQPRVYQATTSTHQGPGGIRETRKTVRDSESGVEKMAVGRHLDDKGVVITRSRNRRTQEEEECKDFLNLDEGKDLNQVEFLFFIIMYVWCYRGV